MTPNPNPYEGDSFLRTMPLLTPEEHEAVRQKYRAAHAAAGASAPSTVIAGATYTSERA